MPACFIFFFFIRLTYYKSKRIFTVAFRDV